jgi:hypothetical protein
MNEEAYFRWLNEKVLSILKLLIFIQDVVMENNRLDTPVTPAGSPRDYILGDLAGCYWNLTKILADTYHWQKWDTEDRDLIIKEGKVGLEKLTRIYESLESLQEPK